MLCSLLRTVTDFVNILCCIKTTKHWNTGHFYCRESDDRLLNLRGNVCLLNSDWLTSWDIDDTWCTKAGTDKMFSKNNVRRLSEKSAAMRGLEKENMKEKQIPFVTNAALHLNNTDDRTHRKDKVMMPDKVVWLKHGFDLKKMICGEWPRQAETRRKHRCVLRLSYLARPFISKVFSTG